MKVVEQPNVSRDKTASALIDLIGSQVECNKGLAEFSSFRTGGAAKYFFTARTVEEVVRAVKAAQKLDLPSFFLGGGSNILVSDKGYDGLVIRIAVMCMERLGEAEVKAGAGEPLAALVDFAAENSLTGLEFATGIWGTVGGAVYGNAGAYGSDMSAVVSQVTVVDRKGNVKNVDNRYCEFGYRDSVFKRNGDAIVEVFFKLAGGDADTIVKRMEEIKALRRGKHPRSEPSAGCFFKNIEDASQPHGKIPAGRLLEEIGAKNMSVGGAKVFENHANIIVNTGSATSQDIRRLADLLKKKVFETFGIMLEEEVIQLGEF